jgi:hypothetical protein
MEDNRTILLESIREVFPHLRGFSDQQIERKIAAKKIEDLVTDFISYVQRDKIMMRTEKLVEGVRLLKIVQREMVKFQYPPVAITPRSVLDNLSMLDHHFFKQSYKQQKALEDGFPGYSNLIATA